MVQRTRINFSSTLGLFPHTYTHTWTSTDGNVSQLLQYVCSFLREYFGNYRSREERPSRMVLTVTEDTPADMLAGSMELLVQLPREHHHQTQRVTVQRSTPMMDLLVQIATAHKLAASSYTLQAIGERGMVLPHQPNTPIGALDALQVKLLPKQGTFVPRRTKQANQPFETTFRLQQVHLPRNQLYVSRVSPKMNLGEILDEVCREKNLDRNKYELRHPANLEETLDLSLSLQDYHLQEVTLYAKQGRTLGAALSTQDIMALQRQEERRRQQAKQGVFGFVFKKSKEGSLSTDSLGGRSASPARSDETGRSSSPLQPPARPQRKRRPAPKPPVQAQPEVSNSSEENAGDSGKDKVVISHSRNSSDSSGYHEASVLSDNPDTAGRLPETLPRRHRAPTETPRKLAQTSQSSKSLGNLAAVSGTLTRGISSTSLSSTGLRKKRAAPPPPVTRPLSSAISTQALERIVDSEESLTSDMDPSKPPSDIGVPSKANSDIEERPKASSDIGVTTVAAKLSPGIDFAKQETAIVNAEQKAGKLDVEPRHKSGSINVKLPSDEPGNTVPVEDAPVDARVTRKRADTNLSETDALLQKVSDTLSNTLPVSTSNDVPVEGFASPVETKTETTNISKETDISNTKKSVTEQDLKQQSNDLPDEPVVNTSTPNQTVNSQQDTSDYVSAADEDLSIADWEYQLPAPPSAFRDTASPVFDNFDAVPSSPESFRDPDVKERVEILDKIDSRKSSEKQEAAIEDRNLLERETKKEAIQKSFKQQRSDANLKKEVICELENKIGTLPQGTKDFDSRRSSDSSSTPKVAPIDNTLSNFTITTYTRQKNLNIFEDVKDRSPGKSSDDRFKSFATLSRHKSNNVDETEEPKDFNVGTLQGKKRVNTNEDDVVSDKKLEPKMQTESLHRWQSGNEAKSNIQRSKSYVSVCGKSKFQGNSCEDEDVRNDRNLVEIDNVGMKKATSVTGLNAPTTRSNEKFSQWRDNILKRQEEPTKEKQLQSLQVLKSILPQLKNAQQAEENVPKESDNTVLPEKTRSETTSNEHSIESNAVSTRDCQRATSNTKSEPESKKSPSEASSKRYTYSGPPAINLGSWSERPSVNVQIKMDMDYKLGTNKANNKTIVNINGTRDELDGLNGIEDSTKQQKSFEKNGKFAGKVEIVSSDRREPNELAKKLITHTTASGFKKPVLNKVNSEIKTTSTDKPIVTGVELKKNFQGGKQDDNVIDTSPVNFKELSKAFGQDVCLRPKPKRSTLNRRSDLQMETDSGKQNGYINSEYCTNGTQDSLKPKRFTSIVGIQPQNQGNFVFRNGISAINNQPMPVVKGFKFSNAATDGGQGNQNSTRGSSNESSKDTSTESLNSVPQPPRPPTMPVITGVTLKSARPKSMPVQMDPRDVLLESIRNFGGRENLKSAAERC
ncbi:uncharacterized protein LOC143153525 isoform X15 [Ptiloglossa arizonensis]|uniref:uncharacterized protein LOC143153525 isoform X15 n=1 Tax=Ptiloglossa arizonensis TaxID=3350558 RepID=UPI003F9F0308